jgi:hypothetical protein
VVSGLYGPRDQQKTELRSPEFGRSISDSDRFDDGRMEAECLMLGLFPSYALYNKTFCGLEINLYFYQ